MTFIETQPANDLAVARSVGSDPALLAVFEETRAAVVELILAAIGLADNPPPGLRIVVRGWIAMVEESVLHWLEGIARPPGSVAGIPPAGGGHHAPRRTRYLFPPTRSGRGQLMPDG